MKPEKCKICGEEIVVGGKVYGNEVLEKTKHHSGPVCEACWNKLILEGYDKKDEDEREAD